MSEYKRENSLSLIILILSGKAVKIEQGLDGMDLLENKKITSNETLTIAPWDVKVIESM